MRYCTAFFIFLGFAFLHPALAQQNFPVRFNWETEFFPDNFKAVLQNPDVQPAEIVDGYYIRYIQCSEIPTGRMRAELEKVGVRFISYVTFGAYLVALPQDFDLNKLEVLKVRSIVPLKPRWKLAQNLCEEPYGAWAVHGDAVDVILQLYPYIHIPDGARLCRENGMTVLFEGNQNGFLQVRILKDQIEDIAALPFVRHLELLPPPGEPEDTPGRSLHRSNVINSDHPAGLKFDGSGVNVLVRDDGLIGPHIDFQGRLTNLTNDSTGIHGDWVTGIFAGAGNLDTEAKGMATGSDIFIINYQADFQDNTLALHWNENVTITNSSYSDGCNTGYTTITQTVDQQLQENPALMHIFSAGNSNNMDCGYGAGNQWGNITGGHKMAKNCITVANVSNYAVLESYSSRGPAHDGRLKPEIAAQGTDVYSTQPNNTYLAVTGTSMSSPAVAGCLAQLTQAYKSLNNGEEPKAGLLKSVVMNTANDLGNPGPDFKFGWGHINAWRAYQALKDQNWLEGTVDQGSKSTHQIAVPVGTRLAKIMIYWVDPQAAPGAARALVNDLDISIAAPDGNTVYLPWKLDPTPDPLVLNAPAGKGRDSLNNMEQVAIKNPVAGQYTVHINGFEVPMGPQPYFLVWEFYDDGLALTYPAGGEGLVPGELCEIQWDAYGETDAFNLQYSTDAGQSWIPIATVAGKDRWYDWTVPNLINDQIRMQISRGGESDTADFPFSIAPVPENISVEQVCPDAATVRWTPVNDTLSYAVYLLGQQYMEEVVISDTALATFPIQNAQDEQWIAVAVRHASGLSGRRSLAISWPGGLKNCKQPDDVAIIKILNPAIQGNLVPIACSPFDTKITVQLANEGLNPINGASIHYQLNDALVVTESLPQIDTGTGLDFSFQQVLNVSEAGWNTLRVWVTYNADDYHPNDTIVSGFTLITDPETQFFQEGFEGLDFPPPGWILENPDRSVSWSRSGEIIGADGQNTHVAYLPSYFYPDVGAEDYLYLPPIDLGTLPNPAIRFDLAHANYYNAGNNDLRMEVFPGCDPNATPIIIWEKSGAALTTVPNTTSFFVPDAAGDWRPEAAWLKDFSGQKIILRFTSVNDFNHNVYVDNIGLVEYPSSLPDAAILSSTNAICRLDTVYFTAPNSSDLATYAWQFGTAAMPANAQGSGPHAVRYLASGNKNVRLIASNLNGADTASVTFPVFGPPTAKFTWAANAGTVTFTNASTMGQSYFWDFGDGNTSTATDPVHTYATAGVYTVTLTVTNVCSTATTTESFTLDFVGSRELAEISAIRILPNPTQGDFRVELTSLLHLNVQFHLLDAQGRLVKTVQSDIKPGKTIVLFEGLNLAKGLYQLQVQTESGVVAFSLAVQ